MKSLRAVKAVLAGRRCVIHSTPLELIDGNALTALTNRYNSAVSLRSSSLKQCKPFSKKSLAAVRAVVSTTAVSLMRRALFDLAPERTPAAQPRRTEQRINVERRQLLTSVALADERRQFDRREADRARAAMTSATPVDRSPVRPTMRKGLLLDVYV